ncbi:hypothetical protein GALL_268600 [mine drainage metagenome]|uniref:Uncharacterized protein n=1 Tax=mine drainage metagenome TaxID=410659 RepID=A0A1J5R5H2_9ZZZZ
MNLIADAIENVERRLVDVTVLLRFAPGPVLFEVQMKGLGDAILGFDVVAAIGLRSIDELDFATFAHPRLRPQARQFFLEVVGPGDRAHEHAILLAVI